MGEYNKYVESVIAALFEHFEEDTVNEIRKIVNEDPEYYFRKR